MAKKKKDEVKFKVFKGGGDADEEEPQEDLPYIKEWELLQGPVKGTLEEARHELLSKLLKGAHCPCCGQYAKIYCRTLDSTMIRILNSIYDHYIDYGPGWVHVPSLLADDPRLSGKVKAATNGIPCKLVAWGLLEHKIRSRGDRESAAGMYRITTRGIQFLQLRVKVPLHVYSYNKKWLGFGGPLVTAKEASKEKFDYEKTVRGVANLSRVVL